MRNSYKIYYLITYLALRIDLIDLCVLLNGDSLYVVKGLNEMKVNSFITGVPIIQKPV